MSAPSLRGIERPQIVAPASAHPAYSKAAHYFGMDVVRIPLDADYRADVSAAESLVGPSTAVIVASAFSYPYGVMDPVEDLAALADANGVGCHVDACIGGFVLPFLERLGLRRATVGLPRPRRHRDLRGRAQVRLLPEGRVRDPAPRRRLVRAPGVPLRQLGLGPLRLAGDRGRPSGGSHRDGVGGVDLSGRGGLRRHHAKPHGNHRRGAPASRRSTGSRSSATRSDRCWRSVRHDRPLRGRRRDGRQGLEPQPQHRSPRSAPHALAAHGPVAGQLVADLQDAVANHGDSRGVEARYS